MRSPHLINPGQVVYLDRSARPRVCASASRSESGSGSVELEPHGPPDQLAGDARHFRPPDRSLLRSLSFVDRANWMPCRASSPDPEYRRDRQWRSGLRDCRSNASVVAGTYFDRKPLIDPVANAAIGYEAFFLGNADLVHPEPTTLRMTVARRWVPGNHRSRRRRRYHLLSPHRPDNQCHPGHDDLQQVGEGDKASMTSTRRINNWNGSVLALFQNRSPAPSIRTRCDAWCADPEERYALVFVFRVLNRCLLRAGPRPPEPVTFERLCPKSASNDQQVRRLVAADPDPGRRSQTQHKLLAAFGYPEAVFDPRRLAVRAIVERADLYRSVHPKAILNRRHRPQPGNPAASWSSLVRLIRPGLVEIATRRKTSSMPRQCRPAAESIEIPWSAAATPRRKIADCRRWPRHWPLRGFFGIIGLALGIDAATMAAHSAAEGETIAVIGPAPTAYPARRRGTGHGDRRNTSAIVSDSPLRTPAIASISRNRIGWLSRSMLVVKTAPKTVR